MHVEKVEGPGSERTGSRHDGVFGQVGEAVSWPWTTNWRWGNVHADAGSEAAAEGTVSVGASRAGVGPEPVDELASRPLAGLEDDAVSPVAPVACRSRYGPEEQATRNRHIRIHHFVPDVGGTEHYNNAGQPTTEGRTMAPNITLLELVNEVATHAGSDAEVVATVVYLVNSGRVRLCGSFKGARFDLSPDIPRRAAA